MNPEKRTGDLGNMLFLFAMAIVLTFFVFIYLWRNIQFANMSYDIELLNKDKKKLYMEVEALRLTVANYSNINRMEKIFREELGYLPLEIGKHIITLELPRLNLDGAIGDHTPGNIENKEPEQNNYGN